MATKQEHCSKPSRNTTGRFALSRRDDRARGREAKDKGTFGYADTSLASAELAGFMRG
jgi:hypothetical protein